MPVLGGDEQVLPDGEGLEDAAHLVGRHQATPAASIGRQPGDVTAGQQDMARIGAQSACQATEKRGLAGSVRADQRGDAAGVDGQVDGVEHLQAAVALAQRSASSTLIAKAPAGLVPAARQG